jgi:TonB family protein
MCCRWLVAVAFGLLITMPGRGAAQPLPTASGRVLEAADGDVVVVPRDANVTVVRRSQVQARLVYVAAQRALLLFTDPALGYRDGMPDTKSFYRWQVQEPWPLEARWEGSATIDDYLPSTRGLLGMAIHTDRGTILVGPGLQQATLTPPPVAVVRSVSANGRTARGTFDEMEQAWLAGGDTALGGPGAGMRLTTRSSGVPGAVASPSSAGTPAGPVRVGGNIRPPNKTRSVNAVYPQTAQAAGIQGVVIVEITIGTDGAVSDARVLRSIPLLDQAALDAVRQWQYEPTLLNGNPVPVIMTATVNFALQPRTP